MRRKTSAGKTPHPRDEPGAGPWGFGRSFTSRRRSRLMSLGLVAELVDLAGRDAGALNLLYGRATTDERRSRAPTCRRSPAPRGLRPGRCLQASSPPRRSGQRRAYAATVSSAAAEISFGDSGLRARSWLRTGKASGRRAISRAAPRRRARLGGNASGLRPARRSPARRGRYR